MSLGQSPLFIAIEGIDATGKTTLSGLLARKLGARLLSTPPRELHGARPAIDSLFGDGLAAQLFYASTVAHASEVARRELGAGRPVVVDRYWLSTRVYDSLRERTADLSAVEASLLPAEFTVLLEASEEERLRRLRCRGATQGDRKASRHADRLRRLFREALASPLAGMPLVVDTTGLSPDEVASLVLREIGGGR